MTTHHVDLYALPMINKPTKHDSDTLRIYEVRLAGHLDQRWTGWFDGMRITSDADGHTLLSGPVRDQAELHGLLKKIYGLGLTLISVNSTKDGG